MFFNSTLATNYYWSNPQQFNNEHEYWQDKYSARQCILARYNKKDYTHPSPSDQAAAQIPKWSRSGSPAEASQTAWHDHSPPAWPWFVPVTAWGALMLQLRWEGPERQGGVGTGREPLKSSSLLLAVLSYQSEAWKTLFGTQGQWNVKSYIKKGFCS